MTSSIDQHRSTPDVHGEGPSSPDRIKINGDVTQLTAKEKSCRETTKNQRPFIPPSDGTPVNNLPNELLSYIFTLGSEGEKRGDDDAEEEEREDEEQGTHLPFQVLVSHVCRQWRAVAIETPTMWTYLDFEEGPPFDKSRTWLERSKECPLSITLDCTVDSESESESDGSEDQADSSSENELVAPQDRVAMPGGPPLTPLGGKENKNLSSHICPADLPVVRDHILPHSVRWRVFELMVDDFKLMYGILSTLASTPEAPELRVLKLYHYDDNEDYDHFSPVHLKRPFFAPFSGHAPKLRLVTLWGVHVDWETCVFLQGLDELELAYHAKDVRPPYEVFSRILQGSPDLHALTLSASGPAGNPEDWPADVIELPSVRQLSLAFVGPSYASALLKRLVFPNLLKLSLDFDPEDYSAFIEQLASPPPNQRHHSVCQNLVDLKLSGMHCSDTALGTLYAALPNLISLNINCYHLQEEFFDYLFPPPPNSGDLDGYYLPKLTTLTTHGISIQQMRDLVSMRQKIQHVRMEIESKTDEDPGEAWLYAHLESFKFFDDSDDEDEDSSAGTTADVSAESDAEGDGVPGEWVDDDDDSIE